MKASDRQVILTERDVRDLHEMSQELKYKFMLDMAASYAAIIMPLGWGLYGMYTGDRPLTAMTFTATLFVLLLTLHRHRAYRKYMKTRISRKAAKLVAP
jgi:hypothetical protein